MASEAPDSQPLLHDLHALDTNSSSKKSADVSLRSLEDGADSDFSDDDELTLPPGFWRRLRMSMRRRHNGGNSDKEFVTLRLPIDDKKREKKFRFRRTHAVRACVVAPFLVIIFFGIVHILNVFLGLFPILWDDPATSSLDWSIPDQANSDIASHLLDITRDVMPIPCHSHNDYWRRVPLYDALRWGCTGVEADVWLFDEELYVGHSTNALTRNRTFRSMYVDPLVKMLDLKNQFEDFATSSSIKNGVFDTRPAQTLVLLVDFKNDGHDIFPVVSQQLTALRENGYLTYFDGESIIEGVITVVATGNAPFDLVTANTTYRDIFFDAPLDRLYEDATTSNSEPKSQHEESKVVDIPTRGGQGTVGTSPTSHFDATNSYYASVNFGRSIGWLWFGQISSKQIDLIRGQIRGAHARGLKARYWSAPKWPIGLRNKVWKLLVDEGVDYLNGDDLQGMTRLNWDIRRHKSLIG